MTSVRSSTFTKLEHIFTEI